jgi:hypothetical protein
MKKESSIDGLSPDLLNEKMDAAGNPVSNDFNDIPTTFDYRTLLMMKLDSANQTGSVAGVTHGSHIQISAAKHNYEQDHFFESTMQNSDKLEYIKVGGLQEDASIFWERINSGFFDITIDQTLQKILRNFYKLNPLQGYRLQKYADRKRKEAKV